VTASLAPSVTATVTPPASPPSAESAAPSPGPTAAPTSLPTTPGAPTQPQTLLPQPTLAELADEAHVVIASQVVSYKLGDPTYTELVTEVANELLIEAEINKDVIFADFDWSQVLNHWGAVEADLARGVIPYEDQLHWDPGADQLIAFAQAHHMPVIAGNLLYAEWIPSLVGGHYTGAQLARILEYMVKSTVLRYRGRVDEWYVASEVAASLLFGDSNFKFWYDRLGGRQAVFDASTWAHQADPKARLMIYEGPVLEANNDPFRAVTAEFLGLLRDLKAMRAPISDVGIENNFWVYAPPSKADMVAKLREIKAMGYGIAPAQTVVDGSKTYPFWPDRPRTVASVPDVAAAQTRIYRDVFSAYLQTGSQFGIYGFSDAVSEFGPGSGNYNVPDANAMILDANYQPKPAYFALVADLKAYIASKGG
jgi:endo-1,4-beta-xylanase